MSDYLSGRETDLTIGISSYSENKTVLQVIGKSVLGVVTATDIYTDSLQVGTFKFDKFTAENISIGGSLTAAQLISTSTNGIGLQVSGRSLLGIVTATDIYTDNLQVGTFNFKNFTAENISIGGTLTASRFISTVATGIAPISVASSTVVTNLNAQYLNGQPSSYYTNASNLNAGIVPAARLFSSNDFNVFGSLYVSNDLSVGGTSVVLNAQSLQIKDRDIVLGITTNAFGNDISSDLSANHGGIAIASTVGNPLFSFAVSGINSLPDTYKQLMWMKSGAFSGLNTDAFLFNYAVGVGTNQLANGVRLAAGALNVTDTRVSSNLFVGALQGNASTATTSTNLAGGVRGSIPYQDSPGITTLLTAGQTNYILLSGGPSSPPYWGAAPNAAGAFGGITIQDEGSTVGSASSTTLLNFIGPNVRATAGVSSGAVNVTFDDYVSLAGVATNVIGGISSVRTLNVTGPSTIGSVQFSGGIVTATTFVGNVAGTATSANNLTGGVQGSIPYQKNSGITTFLSPSISGLVLITNGSGQDPYWGPVSAASGSFGGITVQDEGSVQGTGSSITTLNFVGPRVTVTATSGANGIATITAADYVSVAGYSTSSGISTNVIGGIASVTSLNVSGISTLGTVQISGGTVTATTFSGNLTGTANINNLNVSGVSTLGSVQISGSNVTATNFSGNLTGTATTANNLSGGVQGSIPFQKSVGITSLLPPGQFGYVLLTNGVGQDPFWGSVAQAAGSLNGITVQDEGVIAPGTASSITALNFVGPRISVAAVSGSGVATVTAVDYVSNAGFSTISGIATNVIGGIASVTSLNVTGISTLGSVQVSGGIVTSTSGIVTYYGDGSKLQGVSAFFVVSQPLSATPTYITFARDVGVSSIGVSTVGSNSFVFIPSSGFVGLGSTTPISKLDVNGDVRVTGVVTATRFAGDGSTLTGINATSIVGVTTFATSSGVATNVIGGISSVTSLSVSGIGTTIPVRIGTGSSVIVVDSMGELGIRTDNPQYPLDVVGSMRVTGNIFAANVISLDANVGEIVRTNAGIVSTNSLNTIVLDTYNTSLYRSAKYVVQISSVGSLIPGTTSISSITGGTNYFPGTYTAQDIVAGGAGVGSYGRATITVVPEFSIGINSCIDGVYTASANLPAGITTNKTVYWTQNQNLSQRQQSQISSFLLTTSGVGYTGVPTLTVDAPIIVSNPVPEVGVGSTARLSVVSMRVSNAVQTSAGFVTSVVTGVSVTFSGPSIGVTALGLVSYGISTINVTSPGVGYTIPPSFTIASPYNPTGFAATVGLGISSSNWVVAGGSGYVDPETVSVTINPVGGVGTGAAISGVSVGSTIQFTITNPGTGYTTPPLVSVTGGSGTGAGVTITRMIVSNVTVTNPGSGVTVGLARTNDITFTGGGAFVTVSAGATAATLVSTGITITNAGFGYTAGTIPTITYNPPGAATAQVGLAISAIQQLSTGIGYTVVPNVTISPGPSVGTTVNAGIGTTLGYAGFAGTTIIAGPGYGATTVYYINVLSNRTFTLSNTIGVGTTSPGTSIVGYGFSIGLSTARTGTAGVNTTFITGITTTGITPGTIIQNNTVISAGTTVSSIGISSIFLSSPSLNSTAISTSFNFGSTLIVGGRVSAVNITEIGSGYVAFQTNTTRLANFDRTPRYDDNVGTGFTFTVASVVNNFQLSDILTLHSVGSGSSTAYVVEQAGIADVAELGEFTASLGTGSTIYNLNFTPTFAYNTVKFNKTLFTV